MDPLPTPDEIVDSLGEVLELIEKLHNAIEASGGDAEVTFGAIAALGAAAGVDEAVLAIAAVAGEVVVTAYIAACAGCAVKVAGAAAVRALLASSSDGFAKDTMVAAVDAHDKDTAVA
jgi:hypothetical protein